MGNYEQLKEAIKAVIKTNGKQEITGQVMQDALLAITSSFGQGALFAGIATPETNPLTPDQNVFYLASQSGVYPNFNGLSVADGEIVVFSLSNGQWTKQILSLGGGGSVTIVNEPDEEDLTTVPQTPEKNVIRFKNRIYDEANASGKGYKILRKYWKEVDGVRKNILTQNMINDANTIYEIRYDFDLNGAEIQIKEGCVLNFVGGSFSNGTINGNNIETVNVNIECKLMGLFIERNFIYIKNTGENIDYTERINNILSSYKNSTIIFDNAIYGINGSYIDNRIGIHVKNNNQYFFNGCTFKQLNNNDKRSSIIYIENVKNLSLGDFKIIGDVDSHISTGATDEWNSGIEVGNNVKNITIHDVDISNMTGDCIDIALYSDKSNINIRRCKLSNSVRNCISIENGEYITIESCEFIRNIDKKVAPNCFIDIEPLKDEGGKSVKNVIIKNNYFNNIKQENQGISLIGTFVDSVSDIEIRNNTFVGNIPLVAVISILGEFCSNVSCSNNIIKITSLEYPYNEDIKAIILVNKATANFNDNIIKGKQAGTIGFRIFNGSTVTITNCTLNDVSIFASREKDVELISNIKLYACKIENKNNESIFFSSYTQNFNIGKCYVKGVGTLIKGTDAIYNISDSNLFSESNQVFYDSNNVLPFNKGDIKFRIKNSVLETGDINKSVFEESVGSIIIENTKIIGGSISILVPKTNGQNEATAKFNNCYICGQNVSKYTLNIDGCNTCKIDNSVIISAGKAFLYGNSDSIIFSNSTLLGLCEKNGIFYSENFNAVDFISCTLNGASIIGRSSQYIEDYKPLASDRSVTLYGGYRWNKDNKKPMWWNGTKWVDNNGYSANYITKGTTSKRPTLTNADDGFEYYDTILKKKILWNGIAWVNMDGTAL